MGARKGGGGKKKSGRKRKANVWDDAEPKAKRGAGHEPTPRPKGSRGSMMGQWKAQKIAQRSKERQFFASVDDKKRWQREQYHDTWERTANAIYKDESDEEAAEERAEEQEAAMTSDSDSDSDGDDALGGKKKNSLFDEFVNTFKPAEVEEEGEEEEEEEYEEVLVDENREEIEEEDDGEEEKEEEAVEAEQDGEEQEDEEQVAAMEKDDEELVENEEEKEEQEDPYRRRYLLSSFAEQDARKFDAQARKFAKVRLPELEEDVAYDVTYRSGVGADVSGVTGVATTPEQAQSKKAYVRSRLLASWKQRGLDADTAYPMGSLERTLSQQMSAYTDVFFAGQTYENTATLRQLSAMHVLNHVLKARDTVTRNNERIKKRDSGKAENQDDEEEKEYRDQGFCRASVLVLLPLRSSAMAFVKQLLELLPATVDTFHNKDRFFSEFGSAKDDDDDEDDDASNDDGKKEWQRVFDEGNNDDCFQLGLSFSRKAVRFYSEYHHADIIIASPLGLRQQLGDEVALLDEAESSDDVKLSSEADLPARGPRPLWAPHREGRGGAALCVLQEARVRAPAGPSSEARADLYPLILRLRARAQPIQRHNEQEADPQCAVLRVHDEQTGVSCAYVLLPRPLPRDAVHRAFPLLPPVPDPRRTPAHLVRTARDGRLLRRDDEHAAEQ
ncbi:hypothetical protein ON010_g14766 [Phytophthora cinnamomi]|nr:hypothetical protein ON010_g14766 [Phytophthora cinnamomi]